MMDTQQQSTEFVYIFFLSILLLILFLVHVTAVQTLASFIKQTTNKGKYDVDSELKKYKVKNKKKKGANNYGFGSRAPLDVDEEEMELFSSERA